MRIGIGLWCLQSTATAPRPFPRAYRELIEDAQLAERVGLDSLWLSEHHGYYDGYCPALLPVASAVLNATTRLRVGTGVLLLPLHTPERVAACAADLHHESGARFELSMGMGYRPIEFAAKDMKMSERRERMERGLEVLEASVADGGPPLWVGVTSVAGARRAGRHGLGLFISGAFAKKVADQFIDAHREAWIKAGEPGGKPPPVGLLRNLWVVDSEAQRRRAVQWVRSSYLVYAGLGWGAADTGVDFAHQIEASMDEVEASSTVGNVNEVVDGLAAYDNVELIVCRIGYDEPPHEALSELIERIGTEVAPQLAGVGR